MPVFMTLSEELAWRGFINQTTLQDLSALDSQTWTFYHGYDASADSQTVGNLAAMMLDRALMRHGHKAVILAGGATSLIGDPGGKDKERPLQSEEAIANNVERAKQQLKRVFEGYDFEMVNNLDWTKNLSVIEFLRDIGKHFSMTPLVQRDYIARRIGADGDGISYAEFSYTVLQGMDYLHLFDNFGCRLQIGGSDQWGNCLSGVDLIRRSRGEEVHVMTLPLIINKATGKKFGKSEAGAIWLDPGRTTPTQFYQFWINSDDEGVEDYLKVFTELDKPTVDGIMAKHQEAPEARHAQRELARAVTTLLHGPQEAATAQAVTEFLTGARPIGEAEEDVAALRREIPCVASSHSGSVIEALVQSGLASSNGDARRLLGGNAISINGTKINRDVFSTDDFQNGRLLLRRGKAYRDSALVELSD
jgi:tyrosyl-tRNA synthetase